MNVCTRRHVWRTSLVPQFRACYTVFYDVLHARASDAVMCVCMAVVCVCMAMMCVCMHN